MVTGKHRVWVVYYTKGKRKGERKNEYFDVEFDTVGDSVPFSPGLPAGAVVEDVLVEL